MFPPAIKFLLIANIGIYLAELVFGFFRFGNGLTLTDFLVEYCALWPLGSGHFFPWQLFTYMFLHEGLAHVGFNMFALWMFGIEVEYLWGTKKFLIYYFICGLGGAVSHLLLSGFFGMATGPMLGASGAIFGVLIAFGLTFPDRWIYFYFLIPIKAKWFIGAYIALEVYSLWNPNDSVAHLAHLGGAVTGIIYFLVVSGGKLWSQQRNQAQQWGRPTGSQQNGGMFGKRRAPRPTVDAEYRDLDEQISKAANPNSTDVKQGRVITQEEIDRILDKIAATGYQNLTEEERDILFEASRRMEEKR